MKTSLRFVMGFLIMGGLEASVLVRAVNAQPMEEGTQFTVFYGRNRDFPSIGDLIAANLSEVDVRDFRVDAASTKQWMLGANAAGHIGGLVLGFTEVLYADLGESGASGRPGIFVPSPRVNIAIRPRLFEWTGGLHVQVPAGTWRVRPYFGGGAGVMRAKTSVTLLDTNGSFSRNDFLYHLDAGVRVFVTRRLGISSEFRSVQIPDMRWYRFFIGPVFRVE
jgi:opacity protein-like surface antigen